VLVHNLVSSRLHRDPRGKHEIQDESSTLAIFPTCRPNCLSCLRLGKGHTVSGTTSAMAIWYVYSLHSTLPSRQPRCRVVPLFAGRNNSSLILVYFLGFVSVVDVCPASRENRLSPRGYELLSLSSTPSGGESPSWRSMGSSCVRWLLSYYRHVRLTTIVGTNRADGG